jgi:hypothetical protein
MDLPNIEAVFDFDFTSELGKKYDGRFTVLCLLDMGQKHRLALEKTRLLGNYANPTDDLAGLAVILSTLRVKIIDAPEWWKQSAGGYNIKDEDALVALYDKVLNAETEWREKLKEKVKQAQEQTAAPANTQ